MALIACPECGQTISSDAVACPHCGLPMSAAAVRIDYVTGEPIGVTPRPAAQVARRPFRYPSNTGLWMMVGGAIAVILGSFMPWVRLGPLTISGMSGDGPITLGTGIVILAASLAARTANSRAPRVLVMLGSAAAVLIAMIDTNRLVEGGLNRQLIGAGLGFIFLGGFVAFVGALLRQR